MKKSLENLEKSLGHEIYKGNFKFPYNAHDSQGFGPTGTKKLLVGEVYPIISAMLRAKSVKATLAVFIFPT